MYKKESGKEKERGGWDLLSVEQALRITDKAELGRFYSEAYDLKLKYRGPCVYFRGLIEISNICRKNCLYCGIRAGNEKVLRYELSDKQVLEEAQFALDAGYGSVVLQGGERSDKAFTDRIARLVKAIVKLRKSAPETERDRELSLGITLSLGEQKPSVYKEWHDAGAGRYLLRVEASNRGLYEKIHPSAGRDRLLHSYECRVKAIGELKNAGFLTGTGVMIGLPFQRYEDLARDILFFQEMGVDMVGMGPYIPHSDTPLGELYFRLQGDMPGKGEALREYGELFMLGDAEKLELSLKMVAVLRHVMPHINIAATTALQVLSPEGRERALLAGANIIMPNVTDLSVKGEYNLYEGKPGVADDAQSTKLNLESNLEKLGIPIGWDTKGDWR